MFQLFQVRNNPVTGKARRAKFPDTESPAGDADPVSGSTRHLPGSVTAVRATQGKPTVESRTARPVLVLVLAALISVWLTGCGEAPEPPLRIGTNVWPGYEPLYLARERGDLDPRAIDLVEYPSASEVIRAFRNHAIDGAGLTMDEVLLLAQDGLAPRVILIMDYSQGGDALLGRTDLAGVPALRGHRVGVENSALGAYVLTRALTLHGLEVSDITPVAVEPDEQENAFVEGRIDAVVCFDPVRSRLLGKGARNLFDSTRIPGEIVDVLVFRDTVVDSRSRQLEAVLAGWFRALAFIGSEPRQAAEIMKQRLRIETDEVLESLKLLRMPSAADNLAQLGGANPPLANTSRALMEVMLAHRLLKHPVNVRALMEPSVLEALEH